MIIHIEELMLLLGFVLIPPLIICFCAQLWHFRKLKLRGAKLCRRVFLAWFTSALLSFLVLLMLLPIQFGMFDRILGIQEIKLGDSNITIMPLAWILVLFIGSVSTWLLSKRFRLT